MEYNTLKVEIADHIATVTLNRPPVNALNERAIDELVIVVEHLSRRHDVAAVVFTGDGTASFVAGADIAGHCHQFREKAARPQHRIAALAVSDGTHDRTPLRLQEGKIQPLEVISLQAGHIGEQHHDARDFRQLRRRQTRLQRTRHASRKGGIVDEGQW